MSDEKLFTVRDVSLFLDISERQVMDLAESGDIPAYKVGGVYLRFKQEQVHEFKKKHRPVSPKADLGKQYSFAEKAGDFLYFNDFYILAGLVVILLLAVIFRG